MTGAKLARRGGDLDAARAWLLQLELTPAVVDAGLTCVHEGGVDSRGSLSGGGEGGGDGGGSLFEAARRMNAMLDDATGLADTLPPEMAAVITPIQQFLQQVCRKSVASIKQA